MYKLFQRSPELRSNEANENQNNTRVSAETVRHESTYIILFLTGHNEAINDDNTTIFTHRPCVSLARHLLLWWRHNRLLMTSQWPGNCDTITWIVIFNFSDINFIYGNIHGRSCKKTKSLRFAQETAVVLYGPCMIVPHKWKKICWLATAN